MDRTGSGSLKSVTLVPRLVLSGVVLALKGPESVAKCNGLISKGGLPRKKKTVSDYAWVMKKQRNTHAP